MPAYIIARVKVENPERLKDYQLRVPAILEQYGGRFIARGGEIATLEGPEETRRIVIMEFPTKAAAETYFSSPEYAEARALRAGAAVIDAVVVAGLA